MKLLQSILDLSKFSFKLGEVAEGPQVTGASSDDDKSMSSDESEIESDEEEREKRWVFVLQMLDCFSLNNKLFIWTFLGPHDLG